MNVNQVPDALNKITIAGTLISLIVICIFVLVFLILKMQIGDFSALNTTRGESQYVECPLQQLSCTINSPEGQIKLMVEEPIESLTPFTITVNTDDIETTLSNKTSSTASTTVALNTPSPAKVNEPLVRSIKFRFEGLDDYMGITELPFKRLDNPQYNAWTATGSIPICTIDSNMWRVTVNIEYKDKTSSYWFKLKTL